MKTQTNSFIKLLLLYCIFAPTAFSQSITNTLGTNGIFTIKDALSNYLTLSQATGQVDILKNLRLENTTGSGVGVILKGEERYLHNFGTNNIFLGNNSGNFTLSDAISNTGIGPLSLKNLTSGDYNIAIGSHSLLHSTSGNRNVAIGVQALYLNTTGSSNTAIGNSAMNDNSTGEKNTSVGTLSLYGNTIGDYNTAVGYASLQSNYNGNQNTAVGYSSLNSNHSGDYNTAVGLNSLNLNTTGNQNTAIGFSSGSIIVNGNNLTLIGYNAEPSFASANNQVTLGNNQITSLRCNVQTITSLSDMRDKKNIKDLSLGLDFLMKLKPRLFNWDKREWYDGNISDGSKTAETQTAGFIAQELDEVQTSENADWLNLVLKDNPEKIEASYGNLLPVMVKAIQELKEENDLLKKNNNELLTEVQSLKLINDKISKLQDAVNELSSIKNNSDGSSHGRKVVSIMGEVK